MQGSRFDPWVDPVATGNQLVGHNYGARVPKACSATEEATAARSLGTGQQRVGSTHPNQRTPAGEQPRPSATKNKLYSKEERAFFSPPLDIQNCINLCAA